MTNTKSLPKHVRRALNQIAHCRALNHQAEERMRLCQEINQLMTEGLSADAALERLRCNQSIVSKQPA